VKVIFLGFGESSLDFPVNARIQAFELRVNVQSELTIRVYEVLTETGIGTFSRRTVHIHERPVNQTLCVAGGP
jgi:small-conductance mechanosensitive channel